MKSTPLLKTFGRRLATARKDFAMSQIEFGEKMGVSVPTLARYERGQRDPGIDFATRAAVFFGVSLDYLAGRTDISTPPTSQDD